MGLDGVSERADKVYQAMKGAGWVSTEKLGDAERITQAAKPLPKNIVLNCLQELETKGYVKRKAREKAAGYYITRLV
jgi:ribosomal protein S19E (S16A)